MLTEFFLFCTVLGLSNHDTLSFCWFFTGCPCFKAKFYFERNIYCCHLSVNFLFFVFPERIIYHCDFSPFLSVQGKKPSRPRKCRRGRDKFGNIDGSHGQDSGQDHRHFGAGHPVQRGQAAVRSARDDAVGDHGGHGVPGVGRHGAAVGITIE